MTHEELIHVLGVVGDAAYRISSETFKVFADYNKQKNAEIEARDAEIRHLRTMIADHEDSDVPLGEAYGKTRDRLTNLEWLANNPAELAAMIYCPAPSSLNCLHEEEIALADDDDICQRCLLDWLKEEHKDA